jgi:Flp pilus assembly protein CpaB
MNGLDERPTWRSRDVLVGGAILALVLILGGLVIVAYWTQDEQQVLVPVSDLPAYHRLGQADLTAELRPERGMPDGLLLPGTPFAGRAILDDLDRGEPIRGDRLSSVLPPDVVIDSLLVAAGSATLDGSLRAGDRVDLVFTWPSENPAEVGQIVLEAVLVLGVESVSEDEGSVTVVVAMPRSCRDAYAAGVAGASLTIVRLPEDASPLPEDSATPSSAQADARSCYVSADLGLPATPVATPGP